MFFALALALLGGTVFAGSVEEDRLWDLLDRARNDGVREKDVAWAAGFLDHHDPFVLAMAEWVISEKVDRDNARQNIVWPRPNSPEWFNRWLALPPEVRLEADYARQGLEWGFHRNGEELLASARLVVARAGKAAIRNGSQAEIDPLQKRIEAMEAAAKGPADLTALRRQWIDLRKAVRPIVLGHPCLDFTEFLFIARHPVHSHRNITGSQYPWVHKPGGDIRIRSGFEPESSTRDLIAGRLGPGHVHGLDLWWDADRLVFAWARQDEWPPGENTVEGDDVHKLRQSQEPTHLFEVGVDGGRLRQLTEDPVWNDFEPTWCADGSVVFASDRRGRSSECGRFSADHTGINLYRIGPAGGTPQCLTDNKDIDRYPHSLDNGLIAYTRWEYQERHFFEVHSIWTVHPDGAMADALFNQHMRAPFGFRDTRSIPGSGRLVSIATGHHTLAYGPLVVVNPGWGINNPGAIEIITPGVSPQEGPMAGRRTPHGGVPDRGGVYQTPWALAEDAFLASYSYRTKGEFGGGDNAWGFAVYYLDAYGNKELLHRDPLLSCAFPIPVKSRERPPQLSRMAPVSTSQAECYVQNVTEDMPDLKPGDVKFIRVAQRVPWPLTAETGAKRWIPGNAWAKQFGFWSWAPVRVIGDVPVEEDGSARFTVPPEVALYFQALDENKMELRRMRTHVTFKAGEKRGCTGCHESQNRAPKAVSYHRQSMALSHAARVPEPPPWGNRKLLGYEWLIQPILDRHCVRCHGKETPKGELNLTAARGEDGFMQSFRSLFGLRRGESKPSGKPLVSVSNRLSSHSVSRVKEFGSHRSPFVTVLRDDALHRDEVRLGPDEWETLATWVDANAPYYDTFFDKSPSGGADPVRNHRLALFPPFP